MDMIRGRYGELESNSWGRDELASWRDEISMSDDVQFGDPRLAKIARLRLLSDPGFPMWDVSYCYGVLKDGRKVRVRLPRNQFRKRSLISELIDMAKESGVYAKGIGLLDPEVISKVM